jgi:hypothetical protein
MLKLAKLRSNDPKKYLPLAVNMLQDRLKQSGTTRMRKQGVRFAHTLETLFTATNDEPELITALLKKKSLKTDLDAPRKMIHENTDMAPIESTTEITDEYRQTLPMLEEPVEPTIPSNNTREVDDKCYPEVLLSNPIISQIGVSVAQMIVLSTVQNQKPLKLTNTQITQ